MPSKARRVKPAQYKSLRLQKKIKHPVRLPSVYGITKKATLTVWQHRTLFGGIIVVYGLLNLLLVQGIAGTSNISSLKDSLDQIFTGNFAQLSSAFGVFSVMLSSAGNSSSPTAGAYQFFLALIFSLALIWALRQVLAGQKIRIRDAYYRGMYPLIPFVLVLLIMGLQLIPMIIGSTLYNLVITQGIAVFAVEKLIWALLYALLALLSLYMLSSSVFALYIVTLPDMTPVKALRSARELVRNRRWTVVRKIVCLPIILLVAAGLVMVPIIIWLTPLAKWTFFILTMSVLLGVHAYIYTLYRELLNE